MTAADRARLHALTTFCYNDADGGSFALDWCDRGPGEGELPKAAPVLLVVHGINGHSDEGYVLFALDMAHRKGWRGVALLHRGCGGTVSHAFDV